MMNLIDFFWKNSRVNIKPGLFSVSRFSGSRNSENIFILMLANENRKLSDKNTFFHETGPKTDGDTLKVYDFWYLFFLRNNLTTVSVSDNYIRSTLASIFNKNSVNYVAILFQATVRPLRAKSDSSGTCPNFFRRNNRKTNVKSLCFEINFE